MSTIVGIDPGLVMTGWCRLKNQNYLVDYGTIVAPGPKEATYFERLRYICLSLKELSIEDVIYIEEPFVRHDSVRSGLATYGLFSAIGSYLSCRKSTVIPIYPQQVKAVLGLSREERKDKKYVVQAVQQRFGPIQTTQQRQETICDAIGVALAGSLLHRTQP